jgi:hypothetical protein
MIHHSILRICLTFKKRADRGIVFLVVSSQAFFNTTSFSSRMIGWTFWTGISVGSLALDVATPDGRRLGLVIRAA